MNLAPFGTWTSPISAELAAGSIMTFQDLFLEGDSLYWSETRPQESGRSVIMKSGPNAVEEMLPSPFSARSRVHEYGGAAFTVYEGIIYFINDSDQRLYKILPTQPPIALTHPGLRLAECKITPHGIVAIAETVAENVENFIALINPTTGVVKRLIQGFDFYSSPAINARCNKIAWICWDHPNMPWDNTQLWVGDLTQEGVLNAQRIDSEITEQSFFQPQWSPQGELVVVSDKSNWWNLYQVIGQTLKPLFSIESEIGLPLWNFGMSTWGFYQNGILCTFAKKNSPAQSLYFFKENHLQEIDHALPYTSFTQIRTREDCCAFIGAAPNKPSAIVKSTPQGFSILRENTALSFDDSHLSYPQAFSFTSYGRKSYAYFYPPTNQNFSGLPGSLPPLIVKIHGGPTAHCDISLRLDIQFWTSRGFALVDVNYTGSTGYGRGYRKAIEGQAGIFDVQDCSSAALHLIQQGLVDGQQLLIMGSSAGGYTALAALTFTQTFQGGAILYGVTDLASLAQDTHKFEAHYLDNLVGPYPAEKEKYQSRSPLFHLEQITSPIIFFQGDEDKIVPPSQTQIMYEGLKKKGVHTELVLFEGEQHGFRKAQNRIRVLEEQFRFFGEILKLHS